MSFFTPFAFIKQAVAAAPSPVLTNLQLWYDVGNPSSYPGSGTAITDLSGNGFSGSLFGGPAYTSGPPAYFTMIEGLNSGDYIQTSTVPYTTTAGTAEVWSYPINSTADFRRLYGSNGFKWDYGVSATGQIQLFNAGSPSPGWHNTGFNLTFNQYQQIVWAYDSGTGGSLYVNGALIGGNATWRVKQNGTGMAWGAAYNTQESLGQRLSIVRMYNIKLNATQVLQNFNADKAKFGL